MAVSKLIFPAKENSVQNKINEIIDEVDGKQSIANLVTSLTPASTDTEYPSAKCVYDAIDAAGGVVDQTYNSTSQNAQSGVAIAGAGFAVSSSLATVATSGSYNDLSNKPTIPTVNNATLTIQKNGSTVKTFAANASSDVTCNITVPTNNNELTNGAGYITGISSSDVTTALGYTPYNSTNPSGYQANVIETIKVNGTAQTVSSKSVNISVPSAVTESTVSGWGFTKNIGTVTSVNNVSPVNGNVTITIPTIPTNVSAFTNDSGYITNSAISNMQTTTNLVTTITSTSTDTTYPSAKCVYDAIQSTEIDVDSALSITSVNAVMNKVITEAIADMSANINLEAYLDMIITGNYENLPYIIQSSYNGDLDDVIDGIYTGGA